MGTLAMTYGEFGAVVNTQDNSHVEQLLDHNVVLEMDGLSSSSDRAMFSEALTLYLYRFHLAQGPRAQLTNLIILEEAHHILARRAIETKESVLETSIRMIRQYGIGYVFVDQSASLISKVAFANSYATLALSQKLRADIQTMAGAMNLTEEQRDALSTLPIGSVVVRLADEHPEAFLVKVPRCPIREGSISDQTVRERMGAYYTESTSNKASEPRLAAITVIPTSDRNNENNRESVKSHPPAPRESCEAIERSIRKNDLEPPPEPLSREAMRFLADVGARPLSTTVSRYQHLHLSRRRGNAIRRDLLTAGIIEAIPIATRSGQVTLYQLSDHGRTVCSSLGIDAGLPPRAGLEHRYWVRKVHRYFEAKGYEVSEEYAIKGDGIVDVVAERRGERLAVEIETGKSDIKMNLRNALAAKFDRVVLVAASPAGVAACQRTVARLNDDERGGVELMTWLDVT